MIDSQGHWRRWKILSSTVAVKTLAIRFAEKVLNFLEKVILPKDLLKVHFFEKRLFRVRVSGEWLSTGNGKEYFRPGALSVVD